MNTAIRITILPPAEALEEDQKLYDIWQGAQQRGFSIEFAAKRVPVLVAPCYVELIVEGLKVAGEGIIGGLAYDIAKALARSIKIQFDGWIVA